MSQKYINLKLKNVDNLSFERYIVEVVKAQHKNLFNSEGGT